jgi:hypothetical protein
MKKYRDISNDPLSASRAKILIGYDFAPRLDILPAPQRRLWGELDVRSFLNDDDLARPFDHAPPGIMDPRSWAY